MHTSEHKVHAKICKEHAHKRYYGINVECPGLLKETQAASVKRSRIYQKRHERPGLFGIPGPVAAPRNIGPHGSEEGAEE